MGLFSFQGRASRMQFWLTTLILSAILMVLQAMMLQAVGKRTGATPVALFLLLLMLPIVWVSLAVSVKRWHDRDKSGWWTLISLVPLIGAIWALVETGFLKGTTGENRFGTDPVS